MTPTKNEPRQPVGKPQPGSDGLTERLEDVLAWASDQPPYDIVVGINAKDVQTTIIHVLNVVCAGLQQQFPGFRSLVVVVDGNSTDDTVPLARFYPAPHGVDKVVVRQGGGPGKGNGVRTLLQIAHAARARASAAIDGDLVSVQPVWLEGLLRPVLYGLTDFVVPHYLRDKWDSVITNHLCYPFTAAVHGTSMRQPIGGEFGLGRRFVDHLLDEDMPGDFGIDIHLSTTAIAEGFRVQEAPLGIKVHASTTGYHDPGKVLSRMYLEVVGTLFDLARRYEPAWSRPDGAGPVLLADTVIPYYGRTPNPVNINEDRIREIFQTGVNEHRDVLQEMLPDPLLRRLDEHLDTGLPAGYWAQLVYAVAAWHIAGPPDRVRDQREASLHALGALGMGRFLRFVDETRDADLQHANRLINDQAHTFQRLRGELTARIRELRNHGRTGDRRLAQVAPGSAR